MVSAMAKVRELCLLARSLLVNSKMAGVMVTVR